MSDYCSMHDCCGCVYTVKATSRKKCIQTEERRRQYTQQTASFRSFGRHYQEDAGSSVLSSDDLHQVSPSHSVWIPNRHSSAVIRITQPPYAFGTSQVHRRSIINTMSANVYRTESLMHQFTSISGPPVRSQLVILSSISVLIRINPR